MSLLRGELLAHGSDGVVLVQQDVAVVQTNLAEYEGEDTASEARTHRNTKLAQHFVLCECKLRKMPLRQHVSAGALEARARVITFTIIFAVLGDNFGTFICEK